MTQITPTDYRTTLLADQGNINYYHKHIIGELGRKSPTSPWILESMHGGAKWMIMSLNVSKPSS
jgi:hypothetical protein